MASIALGSIGNVSEFWWQDWRRWTVPTSLLFHALLVSLVISVPPARWLRPPPVKGILVEILDPSQFQALLKKPIPGPVEDPRASIAAQVSPRRFATRPAVLPRQPDRDNPPVMIRSTQMLSAAILADPRSRQARTALKQLSYFDRREQLCNLEAMEQINAWRKEYEPERLVAYAMSDTSIAGNIVVADGAAFRSARNWYNLRYKCEVAPDLSAVIAFEFHVGEPVPREVWQAHYLPERY